MPADAHVSLTLEPTALGPFRTLATFGADGLGERKRALDISAQVVEQRLSIVVPPSASGEQPAPTAAG